MHSTPYKKPISSGAILSLLTLGVFFTVGVVLFLHYKEMPLVRNSLVYARIAYFLFDLGDEFQAGVHGYNKPLGFAYLTLPFLKLYGATVGLKVVSMLSTALWGIACLLTFNRFARHWSLPEKTRPVYLLFLFFNPLVVYQFISGYPDMLFALSFLLSMYFLDRLLSEDINWFDPFAFTASLLFGIWIKHNGLIIFPIILIFLLYRRNRLRDFFKSADRFKYMLALLLLLASVALLLYENNVASNIFNFGHNKSNFTRGGNRLEIITKNTAFLFLYLMLSFNVILLFTRFNTIRQRPEWIWMVALSMAALLYYFGTRYNLRYYLSLAPFLVMFMLSGWTHWSAQVRYASLILFMAINLTLTLVYNNTEVHAWASEIVRVPSIDNLRLVDEQLEVKKDIELINQVAKTKPNLRSLLFLSSYYNDATHTLWSREGLIHPALNVSYGNPQFKIVSEYLAERMRGEETFLLYVHRLSLPDNIKMDESLEQLSENLFLYEKKPLVLQK